jgi:hypothetical protein
MNKLPVLIRFLLLGLLLLPAVKGSSQETLQTVTTAGSTTNNRIVFNNAIQQGVIATPANSSNNSYVSQYAYTTVNGSTNYLEDYMLLRTEAAYWYNGTQGLGFYNRGTYSEPIMEVISGAYGHFGNTLPAHCAIRNNFIYQFIAGTLEYPGTTDNLITDSATEVLYGITSARKLYANKGLLIGTTVNDPNSMLQVNGNITAKKLTITQAGWPDDVFGAGYKLPSLMTTASYITAKHHLPGIPSAREIAGKGLDIADMQKRQMRKIEELTLYLIAVNKKLQALEEQVSTLSTANQRLNEQVSLLQSKQCNK